MYSCGTDGTGLRRTGAGGLPRVIGPGRIGAYDLARQPAAEGRWFVTFPYVEVFLALLFAYMVYSVWAGLDGRYPIAAALVLLVVTAVTDALGATAAANTLAEYVFFLLGAGVVLLLVEHVREGRSAARGAPAPEALAATTEAVATDAPHEAERPAEQPLDRLEEQSVSVVDAAGRQDDEREQSGDGQPDPGQRPPRDAGS